MGFSNKWDLHTNQLLVRRPGKSGGKPETVVVKEKDCANSFLISLEKPNGESMIMHKSTIPIWYRPATIGDQTKLFHNNHYQNLKEKHLKDGQLQEPTYRRPNEGN